MPNSARFHSPSGRAKTTLRALWFLVVVNTLIGVFVFRELRHLRAQPANFFGLQTPVPHEPAALTFAQAGGYLVVWIAFLSWFSLAYANVPALGAGDQRFRQRWAVLSWFVPVLAFWRPKQIANELWRTSDTAGHATSGPGRRGPWLLTLWWGMFLAGGVMMFAWARADADAAKALTLTSARRALELQISALAVEVVAALLAIAVVRRITNQQDTRRTALDQHRTQAHQTLIRTAREGAVS